MNKLLTYIALAFLYIILSSSGVGKNPGGGGTPSCTSTTETYWFSSLQAYGDETLNIYSYTSLEQFLNAGYTVTVTVKATAGCTFSWSKVYTSADVASRVVSGNFVEGVKVPRTNYSVTIQIETKCDYWEPLYGNWVKYVWSKTIQNNESEIHFYYPAKQVCSMTGGGSVGSGGALGEGGIHDFYIDHNRYIDDAQMTLTY